MIEDSDKIDDDRRQIEEYKQKNEEYNIWINYLNSNTSLEYKMEVIKMINELNVNQKVGRIGIKLRNSNPINEEIIRIMANSYKNVYSIAVFDHNDSVDNINHDQIKQLVRQSVVMGFMLVFRGNLNNSDDGLQLLKEYNQIIKQK